MIRRYPIEIARRATAIALSISLLWSSSGATPVAAFTSPTNAAPHPSPFNLVPPPSLGTVTGYFRATPPENWGTGETGNRGIGKPGKLVVLIQDLHANYGVQKNIAGLLEFLTTKLAHTPLQTSSPAATGRGPTPASAGNDEQETIPFALAVEGAHGPVDSSVLALFPDRRVKQLAADYLMRQGELTGAEYFGIMRGLPKFPVGVENETYYALHRDLFRKTLADRQALVGILSGIAQELQPLERRARLRALLGASGTPARDLIQVEQDLALLIAVANVQATEADVKEFGPRLNQFVALCQSLLASNGVRTFDETRIRRLISSSIDYYAMALMRNGPMVDNTLALIGESENRRIGESENKRTGEKSKVGEWHHEPLDYRRSIAVSPSRRLSGSPVHQFSDSSVPRFSDSSSLRHPVSQSPRREVAVLIAGGFHTDAIAQLLRQRNVSYVVLTPAVDQVTDADQALYVKRLNGDLLTVQDVLTDAKHWSGSEYAKVSGPATPASLSPGVGLITGAVMAAALYGVWSHLTGHPIDASHFTQFTHLHALWANHPSVAAAIANLQTFFANHGGSFASGIAIAGVPPIGKSQPSQNLSPDEKRAWQVVRAHVQELTARGQIPDNLWFGDYWQPVLKSAGAFRWSGPSAFDYEAFYRFQDRLMAVLNDALRRADGTFFQPSQIRPSMFVSRVLAQIDEFELQDDVRRTVSQGRSTDALVWKVIRQHLRSLAAAQRVPDDLWYGDYWPNKVLAPAGIFTRPGSRLFDYDAFRPVEERLIAILNRALERRQGQFYQPLQIPPGIFYARVFSMMDASHLGSENDFAVRADGSMGLVSRAEHEEFNEQHLLPRLKAVALELKLSPLKGGGLYDFRSVADAQHGKRPASDDGGTHVWTEADGIMVIMDPMFRGFEHVGRGAWAVYASDIETAKHELYELRRQAEWALRNGVAAPADIVAGKLGEKIQRHLNGLPDDAQHQLADRFVMFHDEALKAQKQPGWPQPLNADRALMPDLNGSEFVTGGMLFREDPYSGSGDRFLLEAWSPTKGWYNFHRYETRSDIQGYRARAFRPRASSAESAARSDRDWLIRASGGAARRLLSPVAASEPNETHGGVNEDTPLSFSLAGGVQVAAVFDGVGGNSSGEAASRWVAKRVRAGMNPIKLDGPRDQVIAEVRRLLVRLSRSLRRQYADGRATTGTLLIARPIAASAYTEVLVFNAGDSRAYALRPGGAIAPLTVDSGIGGELHGFGEIHEAISRTDQPFLSRVADPSELSSARAERVFRRRNQTTNLFLASSRRWQFPRGLRWLNPWVAWLTRSDRVLVDPQVSSVVVPNDVRLFVTSDGIHDNLTDKEIGLAAASAAAGSAAQALVREARERSRALHLRAKDDDLTAVEVVLAAPRGRGLSTPLPEPPVANRRVPGPPASFSAEAALRRSARPRASLTLGQLLKHFRVGQAARGLIGILVNTLLGRSDHDKDTLRRLQNSFDLAFANEGRKITLMPLEGSRFQRLTQFGDADKSADFVSVNLRLPPELRLLTAVHEALHLIHPGWSESQVIATSEAFVKQRRANVRNGFPMAESAEQAAAASPRAVDADLISILSNLLAERHVQPKEAASVTSLVKASRRAFLDAA